MKIYLFFKEEKAPACCGEYIFSCFPELTGNSSENETDFSSKEWKGSMKELIVIMEFS